MSPREALQILTICGALSLTVAARADDSPTNTVASPTPTFRVTVHKGEIVGSEQIQRAMITSGTNEFLLVAPDGLTMDTTRPNKILLYPSDKSFFLTFRMTGTAADDPGSQSCRKLLEEQYPGAQIVEEFSITAAGRSGPAFDLRWKSGRVSERFVRVAFIPSAAGLLEFSRISDAQNAGEAQRTFNGMIRAFRSNEKGKIEIKRSPDWT